eukprot:scaffold13667_cov68-Phaeocystis_antarctica.AAC.5
MDPRPFGAPAHRSVLSGASCENCALEWASFSRSAGSSACIACCASRSAASCSRVRCCDASIAAW